MEPLASEAFTFRGTVVPNMILLSLVMPERVTVGSDGVVGATGVTGVTGTTGAGAATVTITALELVEIPLESVACTVNV